MADLNAQRDENRVTALIVEKSDGSLETVTLWADATTHRLLVNSTVSGAVSSTVSTTIYNGQKAVAVTNTAVALAASQAIENGVIVQALSGNAASIYVGSSAVTTSNGFELQPGQATSIAISNLATVFINGTSGDGVCYIAGGS